MKITRSPRKEHNFLIVSNSVVRDKRLSFKARGILLEILSQPDGWNVTAESLANEGQEGISAVLSAFKELRKVGYMRTEKLRDAKGQFVSTTQVFEDARKSEPPALENPISDNLISLEEPIKEEPKDSPRDRFSNKAEKNVGQALAAFETFWEAYPRKDGRKNSTTAFNRALKVATLAEILAGVERLKAEKRDPKFIPLASSWLNGERWTDEGANPVTEVLTPTKIPPRFDSNEFSNPDKSSDISERVKALKKALRGDYDEVEFP